LGIHPHNEEDAEYFEKYWDKPENENSIDY